MHFCFCFCLYRKWQKQQQVSRFQDKEIIYPLVFVLLPVHVTLRLYGPSVYLFDWVVHRRLDDVSPQSLPTGSSTLDQFKKCGITLFPSTQLSVYMAGYRPVENTSCFSSDLLLQPIQGADECLLDSCQVSSIAYASTSNLTFYTDLVLQNVFRITLDWVYIFSYYNMRVLWPCWTVMIKNCWFKWLKCIFMW